MPDTVIPIVFPDYLVAVVEKNTPFDVLPWFDFDNFTIPKTKVPELGHAGVLFFSDGGVTKYYEYGRYDPPPARGVVRRVPLPNLKMTEGSPTRESLVSVLLAVTNTAGQGGRIQGVSIEVPGKFNAMLRYAQLRAKQNVNSQRPPYDILGNSCIHFVKRVVEAAGVRTPWMLDPRPTSYIGEFRADFPDLDFDARSRRLVIAQ